MELLREATRRLRGCASPRALVFAVLALFGALLPTFAFAGEADVQLNFAADNGYSYLLASLIFGVAALLFALFLSRKVLATSPGSEKMQEVGMAIKEGA